LFYYTPITSLFIRYQIDVKGLCISVNGRELLAHAELKLKENVHYVLIGRNGTGKSSVFENVHVVLIVNLLTHPTALLRALGEAQIPGVPWNLRILLLGQTNPVVENVNHEGTQIRDINVLEHVICSDTHRENALREAGGTLVFTIHYST
jgi:ATP-binding cassette subfamily F protein 3